MTAIQAAKEALEEALAEQEDLEECGDLEERLVMALMVDKLRANLNALLIAEDETE